MKAMMKWALLLLLPALWTACDSHTTEFEGRWQLAQVESSGTVTPVDTVWYNFQTSLFQYQIYDRASDSYPVLHGYHTYADGVLSIELFQQSESEQAFLLRTDWSSPFREFKVEKLDGKQLILSDDGKRYIFRKY